MSIVQDTITFHMEAQETVVNKTVKIKAQIVAKVKADDAPGILEEMRAVARNFINVEGCDWQFSDLRRGTDNSGLESIEYTISIRVPGTENYNLENRARAVSRQGLSINNPETDTSLPQHEVDATISRLRKKIVSDALTECASLSESFQRPLRVHQIIFNNGQAVALTSNAPKSMRAFGASAESYGGNNDDDMGNAMKIRINATVSLGIIHAREMDGGLRIVTDNTGCASAA